MKKFQKAFLLAFLFLLIPTLSACNQNKKDVVISTVSSNEAHGTVSGGGVYIEDEFVTLVANPKFEGNFVAWIKNNKIVSEDKEFSFKASLSHTGTYTAVFKGDNPSYIKPFAFAFNVSSLKPNQLLTLETVTFDFALGNSTQTFNIATQNNLGFDVYENAQTSSIYTFDSAYLLRIRSSYGQLTYTFSTNLSYFLNETAITRSKETAFTFSSLEPRQDAYSNTFYEARLQIATAELEATLYFWFAPAGVEIFGEDILVI